MLPSGITGFRDLNNLYIPEQEEKMFKKFCYFIASCYHCAVVLFDLNLTSKNFYFAEMKTEQDNLYLLENAYYPWIAFAKSLDFTGIEFIESPFDLAEQNVHVLTLSDLQKDWHDFVGELSKVELEQIEYWKPKRIGDIVFNFWD